MAESYKKLFQSQVAAASGSPSTTTYTTTSGTQTIVKQMRIVNTSSAATTIKIGNGGITDGYVILPATSIDAGGFAEFEGTITLAAGETLVFQAGAASSITVTAYGVEIT